MNITLVCGHYLPRLGYVEVHLARAFDAAGHAVTVVTSNAVPKYVAGIHSPLNPGAEYDGTIKIIRLKPAFALGQVVVSSGLNQHVSRSKPDLIFVIGLGKRFPKPVFDIPCRIITLLGDNDYSYAPGSVLGKLKSKLLFRFLKRSTYLKALKKSAALVAYTPEGFQAVASVLPVKYKEKLLNIDHFISLGFWPHEFFYDAVERDSVRASLGLRPDQVVIITATRVVPEKRLEKAVELIRKLPNNYVWLVVGSKDDGYAKEFERGAERILGNKFILLPFAEREGLKGLYNAADFSLYTVPAISIFESLGTGLACILPNKKSVSHVITPEYNGLYFEELSDADLPAKIENFNISHDIRIQRVAYATERFSWANIAERLIKI